MKFISWVIPIILIMIMFMIVFVVHVSAIELPPAPIRSGFNYYIIYWDNGAYRATLCNYPMYLSVAYSRIKTLVNSDSYTYTYNGSEWTSATLRSQQKDVRFLTAGYYIIDSNHVIYNFENQSQIEFNPTPPTPTPIPQLQEGQAFPSVDDSWPYVLVYYESGMQISVIYSTQPLYVAEDFIGYVVLVPHDGADVDHYYHEGTGQDIWIQYSGYPKIYGIDMMPTFFIEKPLRDYILYCNYDLFDEDMTIGYYNDDYSTYDEDGFPTGENDFGMFPAVGDERSFPYRMVYVSASDGQVKLLVSSKPLRFDRSDVVPYLIDIYAVRGSYVKEYWKDGDTWELQNAETFGGVIVVPAGAFDPYYLDSLSRLEYIYYVNFDIYNLDGTTLFYDDSQSPYDEGGNENIDWDAGGSVGAPVDEESGILQVIMNLFVPNGMWIEERNEELSDALSEKLGFSDLLAEAELSGEIEPEDDYTGEYKQIVEFYGLEEMNVPFINFSFYEDHKSTMDGWIRGLVYFLLLIFNINQVYKLLHQGGSITDGANVGASNKGGKA